VFRVTYPKMTFACSTTDHQGLEREEPGKTSPNSINGVAHGTSHAFGKILPNEEERLNRAHLFLRVLKNQKVVIKGVGKSCANQFVEPVILELVLKCFMPRRVIF